MKASEEGYVRIKPTGNAREWLVTAYNRSDQEVASLQVNVHLDQGDGPFAELSEVVTFSEYRRQGFATLLFDALDVWPPASSLAQTLCVYNDNKPAIEFYKRVDFTLTPACEEMQLAVRHFAQPTRPVQSYKQYGFSRLQYKHSII